MVDTAARLVFRAKVRELLRTAQDLQQKAAHGVSLPGSQTAPDPPKAIYWAAVQEATEHLLDLFDPADDGDVCEHGYAQGCRACNPDG